ncbi:MAG: YhdT family protein, partial [Clostridiales bacterium]|nr:YhdT family protein [Clostridiales bacterium]
YVLGLPMWFFISCVVGYVLFCVVSVLVVKLLFKDFDLEEVSDEE